MAGCCNVQLFIRTSLSLSLCVFFRWKISLFILGHQFKKTKQNKKQQHRVSPSSSVDPGIFVFCQRVSPLKRYHECFPCNKKSSFLQSKTWNTVYSNRSFHYTKLCCNNLKLNRITKMKSGKSHCTLHMWRRNQNILLPLKIRRHRQRLVEILLPYQPICVLNPFALGTKNH